jgi:uncharacterized membrane protein YeaQ/YmgE (transglycosylase-associated protein family)
MRRRIYWLLPDVMSARRTMDDLLLARVPERYMHFVGREDISLGGLHAANILQTSDVVRSAQAGLVFGGIGGAVLGILAGLVFPIVGDTPDVGMVAVLGVLGGLVGAWSSSMIGASVPSRRLQRFAPALARGEILLMVDVPRSRIDEIESRLQSLHPEAHLEGVEPNIPAFP